MVKKNPNGAAKKPYRRPEVKTSSGDKLVKNLGPAQTCSPSPQQCQTSF